MIVFFAIFALCLVAANAGTVAQTPDNYETMVEDILNEMAQIANEAAEALQQTVEDTVLDPLSQVDNAVESIEARRSESEECVAAEDERVLATVDTTQKDMAECGVALAKTSADIMNDIGAATQQLIFDGYDLLRNYQRCQSYNSFIFRNACYAPLSIKATFYMVSARSSINTIRESTNERIPAAISNADSCIQTAADTAVHELENILADIDACIAK